MSRLSILAAILIHCWIEMGTTALAQLPAPLPVDDVIHLQSLGEEIPMEFSPDGKLLAYTVHSRPRTEPIDDELYSRTGVPWFAFGNDLFVVNIKTHESRNLTAGRGDNWLPAWSPDGRYLAFMSDRGGGGQAKLWIWDSVRDEIRKASDVRMRMGGWQYIAWAPDSQTVLVTVVPEGQSVEEYVRRVTGGKQDPQGSNTRQSASPNRILYNSGTAAHGERNTATSDPWNLDWALRDLVLVDMTTGKATTIVHGKRINMFRVSPDGLCVIFSSPQRFEKPGSQQVLFDVVALTLATRNERVVASSVRLTLPGAFSIAPNSLELSYRSTEGGVHFVGIADGVESKAAPVERSPQTNPISSKAQWPYSLMPLWDTTGACVYYIDGGVLWRTSKQEGTREVTHIEDYQIKQLISRRNSGVLETYDAGKSTIVIARENSTKQEAFFRIELASGVATRMLQQGGCYTCGAAFEGRFAESATDGRSVAYMVESAQRAADIWLTDTGFREGSQLTRLNPEIERYQMGAARVIEWLDADGDRLRGALILPSTYQQGKRYPLIVLVYGGATLSDFCYKFGGFEKGMPQFNIQLLATRGYAVLMPDAPEQLGTPMFDLTKTVLPGVNKVIEMGIADPERLGLMGHSYGGYGALSLIVQTKRFKAAVEADGYADLIGAYGELDKDGTAFGTSVAETGQEMMGGTPWEYRDRYVENSPIFYLERVQTPVLIVHGGADVDVLPFLADELFVGLRRLGKEVEYVRYADEPHVISGYANQLDLANRMIAWFDKYLKN